jgi:hypothetical protein
MPFRLLHGRQTMKEVALVIEGRSDYYLAGAIHEAPFAVPNNLK